MSGAMNNSSVSGVVTDVLNGKKKKKQADETPKGSMPQGRMGMMIPKPKK